MRSGSIPKRSAIWVIWTDLETRGLEGVEERMARSIRGASEMPKHKFLMLAISISNSSPLLLQIVGEGKIGTGPPGGAGIVDDPAADDAMMIVVITLRSLEKELEKATIMSRIATSALILHLTMSPCFSPARLISGRTAQSARPWS
jgi:hypothetical protein